MNKEEIVNKVSQSLDHYSEEVQGNLKQILLYFEDDKNLTEIEKEATEISFWRSIDDKSCSAMVGKLIGGEHEELESKYDNFEVFKNWEDCALSDEIYEYAKDDYVLLDEIEAELEVCYLQWFVRNWYAVDGHLAKRLEYFIIENNSVRNFDLLRFNFTDLFLNHKGPQKEKPYYKYLLTSHEVRQRVLMDMVDHTYHKPLKRTLVNGDKKIEFWYSKCELIIRDLSQSDDEKIIISRKIKENENANSVKYEYLSLIVKQIDELIEKGYKEI